MTGPMDIRKRIDTLAKKWVSGSSFGEGSIVQEGGEIAKELGFPDFVAVATQEKGGALIMSLACSLELDDGTWGVQISGNPNLPPYEQLASSPRMLVTLGTMDGRPLPLESGELDSRLASRGLEVDPSLVKMGNYHIEVDRRDLDDVVIFALDSVSL